MKIALVHDHFDSDHLEAVTAQMQVLGAPTIKAVWMECYRLYAALEGCHRIRAAAALGLTPVIDEVEYSDVVASTVVAIDGDCTVADICDSACNSVVIDF